MAGFVKLYGTILDSTVWRESHSTVRVWIAMLAMADAEGLVESSVPGLADRARVTLSECVEALRLLAGPDEWSRTKTDEGRRIREVEDGWVLLNHRKYRERRSTGTERVAEHRKRKALQTPPEAEAEVEAEAPPKAAEPLALVSPASPLPKERRRVPHRSVDPRAEPVLAKLDAYRVGLGLRPLPPSQRVDTWIVARLDEGVPVSDLLLALDLRAADVQRDPGGLRYFDACSPFTGPGSRGPGGWSVSARMIDEAQRRGKGPTAPGLAPAGTAEAAENYARLVEIERDKDLRAQEAASIAARGGAR